MLGVQHSEPLFRLHPNHRPLAWLKSAENLALFGKVNWNAARSRDFERAIAATGRRATPDSPQDLTV